MLDNQQHNRGGVYFGLQVCVMWLIMLTVGSMVAGLCRQDSLPPQVLVKQEAESRQEVRTGFKPQGHSH